MTSKICVKCKIEKDLKDFRPEKRHVDGRRSRCADCEREYGKLWRRVNRNIEKDKQDSRKWYKNNIERARELSSQWRKKNPERCLAAQRNWKAANIEKVRADLVQWHKDNPGKHGEYNKKRRSSLKRKLNMNISTAICNSLQGNKNGWHWEDLVGYTLSQLKKHLEKQFVDGMSWGNYGLKGWTIDHKIPITAFNFETPFDLDFRQCWALRNLQPLWHTRNMSKKDKLFQPHQPSLLI